MSSPSDNISSGRSSPDDGIGSMRNGVPRRSSTPAQSFLPPRFWTSQPHYQMQSNNNADAPASSVPRRTSFGTTFSNGGRLSALSALGMSPHTNPALYGYKTNMQQQQSQQHSSSTMGDIQRKRTLSPGSNPQYQRFQQQQPSLSRNNSNDLAVINSAESTPTPSMPSSPVQKPKRSVCLLPGPDGLCVESRGRRRSEA